MATKPAFKEAIQRTQLDVFLGRAAKLLGRLIFIKDGHREFSQFAYSDDWLIPSQMRGGAGCSGARMPRHVPKMPCSGH